MENQNLGSALTGYEHRDFPARAHDQRVWVGQETSKRLLDFPRQKRALRRLFKATGSDRHNAVGMPQAGPRPRRHPSRSSPTRRRSTPTTAPRAQASAEDPGPGWVVRQQDRDLGHCEHKGQVEEELERCDFVLVAAPGLRVGPAHPVIQSWLPISYG